MIETELLCKDPMPKCMEDTVRSPKGEMIVEYVNHYSHPSSTQLHECPFFKMNPHSFVTVVD